MEYDNEKISKQKIQEKKKKNDPFRVCNTICINFGINRQESVHGK